MASFKDTNGRQWVLKLDAPTVSDVRSECDGLDLANLDGKSYERMAGDLVLLVETLWVICREQAQPSQIVYTQFAAALTGDVLDGASAALLEAVVDFFPPSKRALLQAVAAKSNRVNELATQEALAAINNPNLETAVVAEVRKKIDEALSDLIPSMSATNTPDSLESAPKD